MRHKKEVLYPTEQSEIRRTIFNLLKLDEQQSITLVELDKDLETQIALMDLLPQIRQYFSVSKIPTLAKPEQAERPCYKYLSIIIFNSISIKTIDSYYYPFLERNRIKNKFSKSLTKVLYHKTTL